MALEPGYMVSKHVRLVRKLKGGGMGSVWVADHLALHTEVAVKFISGDHVAVPELSERFKREATSAARIKSPHVVQIHDHGVTDEGLPFIVMELLEGEDLSTRLKRVGPMSLDDVVSIVEQTCRVLTRAHKLGIVHRDIKPANLFLVEADGAVFVKLLDFGVAKSDQEKSDLTNTGVMVGTMVYMSPEQLCDARNVDHRADLWSLAVVAYRSLTGQLPFKDDNGVGALVLAVDRGVFEQASALVPGVPESIDPWFAKAFRRQAEARFASAKDMSQELLLALGRKVPTEELSPQERATLPDRPEPATPFSGTKIGLNPPPAFASPPKKAATPERKSHTTLSASAVKATATTGEDAGTVGGLSAQPVKKRNTFVAWALISVMGIVVLGIGGAILMKRLKTEPEPVSAASSTTTDGPITTEVASQIPSSSGVASAPEADTASASSTSAGAAPSALVSSSAPPSSAASTASPQTGPRRRVPPPPGVPPKTEKDYGF